MKEYIIMVVLLSWSAISTVNTNEDSGSRLLQLEQTVLDLQTQLKVKEQNDAALLSLLLSQLSLTTVEPTTSGKETVVSLSRVLHLEQTVLDMQSQFQAQEQKYVAVLSSVLSKLTSTTDELELVKKELEVKMNVSTSDELSSVQSELRNVKSDFEALQSEHMDLKLKMKEQENKTLLLKSDLTASETNLQSVISTEVFKLTSDITLSINSVQSNVTSVASEQVNLSAKVDNIRKDVSQLKASDNSDSTCDMSSSGCPQGFIRHDSSCYLFSRTIATFPQAHSMCQFLSSHLAVITSSNEDSFLRNHLNTLPGTGTHHTFSIGGSDLSQEGTWTWGCPFRSMTYTNWPPNRPDNDHGENCLALKRKAHYQWDDDGCNDEANYICERKAQ